MEKGTFVTLCAMDRTGATYVEAPVNRDAVLRFILIMFFLQRSSRSSPGEGSATFSLFPKNDLQLQGFPSGIEFDAASGFS